MDSAPTPPRPTLVDVARDAGVSRATASRVLSGGGNVTPDRAARVHEAARRLGYRTNTAARALRRGGSGSVGIVVPGGDLEGLAGPFIGAPLQGASAFLLEHALQPVLLLADGGDPALLVRHLASGHVDAAVVVLQRETETIFRSLDGLPVPVVYVGHPTAELDEGRSFVDSDNYGGARLATRALLEAGRTRPVTVTGLAGYQPAADRLRGFHDELDAWGIAPGPAARGDFTLPSGAAAMVQLLRREPRLDAVFAGSDLMAVGAMRALGESGRRVPDDVSVVGFDDTVVAATANPGLTSVHQPLRAMGRRAAQIALAALDDPAAGPVHEVMATTLTLRQSV